MYLIVCCDGGEDLWIATFAEQSQQSQSEISISNLSNLNQKSQSAISAISPVNSHPRRAILALYSSFHSPQLYHEVLGHRITASFVFQYIFVPDWVSKKLFSNIKYAIQNTEHIPNTSNFTEERALLIFASVIFFFTVSQLRSFSNSHNHHHFLGAPVKRCQ